MMLAHAKCFSDAFGRKLKEKDKQKHFWVCFILILVLSIWFSLAVSVVLTFFIGIMKEIWDQQYGSGFCWYDVVANSIGIFMGVVFLALVEVIRGML